MGYAMLKSANFDTLAFRQYVQALFPGQLTRCEKALAGALWLFLGLGLGVQKSIQVG